MLVQLVNLDNLGMYCLLKIMDLNTGSSLAYRASVPGKYPGKRVPRLGEEWSQKLYGDPKADVPRDGARAGGIAGLGRIVGPC
jgi:hypothetical protein